MWTIYCHTHVASGKRYVGQTKSTMEFRWRRGHVRLSRMGSEQPLHRAIRKYGEAAFDHEVLAACQTLEEANVVETKWIAHYRSDDLTVGYNLDEGGKAHNTNAESKRKISAAATAWWAALTPEARAAQIAKSRHVPTTEELDRRRAYWAAMSPEERRAVVRAGATDEEISARCRAGAARRTPEERSASAKLSQQNRPAVPPEVASARVLQAWETRRTTLTDAERYEIAVAAAAKRLAATTKEQRAASSKKAKASMTPEERSDLAHRAWATKRAKAAATPGPTLREQRAAACPLPRLRFNLLAPRLTPAPRRLAPAAPATPPSPPVTALPQPSGPLAPLGDQLTLFAWPPSL